MPTFTMELKTAIDLTPAGWSVDKWIGLDDYPLFDESRRAELNQKIIREYWNQEIGMETVSMFAFAMRRKMHKEMPLVNLLYESAALEFDALVTIDMKTSASSTGNQTGEESGTAKSVNTNTSNSKSTSLTVASDFPQSALSDRGAYASSSQDGDGSSNVSADAEANDTSKSNSATANNTADNGTVKGFQGSAADLILAKRATFMNLDARVVDMLSDCFIQLWADGSQHLMRSNY